jgi:NAD(P)H-dependent flavin oxidoreductase YrpB (nitropropane dioxygenase family)
MTWPICERLGIDFPLFAFSHCRDVVAAVTNAGGMGVLGASSHSPEHLEHELAWIDGHVNGKPYGVDIIMPDKFFGKGQDLSRDDLAALIPPAHRDYVTDLLAQYDIDYDSCDHTATPQISEKIGEQLLQAALNHPIGLIANALGVPPHSMIEAGRRHGIAVAALVGAKEHAIKQVEAGVDVIIAQGTEAGGHCGEVTTMVLVPEVVAALAPIADVPVLAAGGIVTGRQMAAAVALGAAGAWTGSVWLTTREAETAPYTVEKMLAASSRDTVRSPGRTGKPSRQLISSWTDAWLPHKDGREPLPMPLQTLLTEPVLRRVDDLAAQGHVGARELATYWVGQGIGLMNVVKPAGDVVQDFIEDYLAAVAHLSESLPSAQ